MFAPKRITIRNLGSIPHAVIEPHPTGITALDGPTGSGKSSAMNVVAWTLFGYIGGVDSFNRQADLRFDLAPDGETAEGIVEFDWKGTNVKAVRRLRRSKSGRDAAEAELWLDGEKQPTITPDRLTEKVTELTGLTGKAFVSTYFIPQMQLERMAMGTPSEVQSLIEDRTGLTALTRRITAARADVQAAGQAAEAMPGSPEEVSGLQDELDSAQRAGVEAWDNYETAQATHEAAQATHEAAQGVLGELMARQQATSAATREIDTLLGRREALTEQSADWKSQLDAMPDGLPPLPEITARQAELGRAVDAYRKASAPLNLLTISAEDAETASAAASAASAAAARDAEMAAQHGTPNLDERVAEATATLAALDTEVGVLRARHEQIKENRQRAGEHRHDVTCPTCQQTMPDPSLLFASFEATLAEIVKQGKAAATERDRAEDRLRSLTAERAATVERAAQATEAARQATQMGSRAEQARAALVAAHNQARDASGALVALLPTSYNGGDVEAAACAFHEHLSTLGQMVQRRADATSRMEQVAAQLANVKSAVEDAQRRAADRVVDSVMEAARRSAADAQATLAESSTRLHAAHMVAERTRADVAVREQHRDAAQQRLDAKTAATTHAETLRLAGAALAEQRKELLAEFTATISDAASRIMEAVGGGRHVGVHIDERFVPEVILADGRRRAVATCSGGEKLRAALCLVLGQIEQQSGGDTSGMLFADEIATGYDAATTMAVMDTIAGLGRPTTIIGHNPQVPQIAQKVYQFTNEDDQGTVVTEAAERGIHVAQVPVAASPIKRGKGQTKAV